MVMVFKHMKVSCKERNNLFCMLIGDRLRSHGFKSQKDRFMFDSKNENRTI